MSFFSKLFINLHMVVINRLVFALKVTGNQGTRVEGILPFAVVEKPLSSKYLPLLHSQELVHGHFERKLTRSINLTSNRNNVFIDSLVVGKLNVLMSFHMPSPNSGNQTDARLFPGVKEVREKRFAVDRVRKVLPKVAARRN